MFSRRCWFCVVIVTLLSVGNDQVIENTSAAEESAKSIALADAGKHVGEEVQIEYKIESGYFKDPEKPCFLNSAKSHRDKDNFTLVIFPDTVKKFKEAGIEDPALHFTGKVIVVKGKLELHQEKLQLIIKSPQQLKIKEATEEK